MLRRTAWVASFALALLSVAPLERCGAEGVADYSPPPAGQVRIVRDTYGVPHIIAANAHNRGYLLTKATRSGHLLEVDDLQPAKNGGSGAAAPKGLPPRRFNLTIQKIDPAGIATQTEQRLGCITTGVDYETPNDGNPFSAAHKFSPRIHR